MNKEKKINMNISVKKAADILRGSIDSSEYKEILLPLVFYKYLSDVQLTHVIEITGKTANSLKEAQNSFEILCKDDDTEKIILKKIKDTLGYTVNSEFTFMAQIQAIDEQRFQTENLSCSLKHIEEYNDIFDGIFEDTDLLSKKFGHTLESNNKFFSEILYALSSMGNMTEYSRKELGDFFEETIASTASASGRKSGDFFSPQSTNKVMAKIAILGSEKKSGLSVYDPTMGSGSLLLSTQKFFRDPHSITFYGQEINASTFNLARMNMFFHGVPIQNQHLNLGDTLGKDWPKENQTKFDTVLMIPPFSLKWVPEDVYLDDPRFKDYGVLAPKSKADYTFLLHGYHHLNEAGTMVIILPHGVLFRGGSEGQIRQSLLEKGAIDCVIGLPSNLMYGTSIPTVAIVLKKTRSNKDVLFIDASQEFEKDGYQVTLTDKHINKIVETYKNRNSKSKYAYIASLKEIMENDYNLNIPRYINTFEEEELSIKDIENNFKNIAKELEIVNGELKSALKQCQVESEIEESLKAFIQYLSR